MAGQRPPPVCSLRDLPVDQPSICTLPGFEPRACAALLAWAGLSRPADFDYAVQREASIDRLADALNEHLQIDALLAAMR